MTKSQFETLVLKYSSDRHSMPFDEACGDVNRILDSIPAVDANNAITKILRAKYSDNKASFEMAFWIVKQDVLPLLYLVVTSDSIDDTDDQNQQESDTES